MRKLGTGHELSPMRFLRGESIGEELRLVLHEKVFGRGVVLFVFEDQFDQNIFDNGDDSIGVLGCSGRQAWGTSSTIPFPSATTAPLGTAVPGALVAAAKQALWIVVSNEAIVACILRTSFSRGLFLFSAPTSLWRRVWHNVSLGRRFLLLCIRSPFEVRTLYNFSYCFSYPMFLVFLPFI